jgi:hypothetical protein
LEIAAADEAPVECEVLLLPLCHTRDTIERVLGAFSPMSSPDWLGEKPVVSKRVIMNDVVWPSRDHYGAISRPIEPPSLDPSRSARIVRSQRRQFQVFEGGLSNADPDKT